MEGIEVLATEICVQWISRHKLSRTSRTSHQDWRVEWFSILGAACLGYSTATQPTQDNRTETSNCILMFSSSSILN